MGILACLLVFLEKPWRVEFPLSESPRDHPTFARFVQVWIWWASGINLCLLACVLWSWRWWGGGDRRIPAPGSAVHRIPREVVQGRCQRYLLVLSLALAAWLGAPRLTQSLWGDELIAYRESIAGSFSHVVGADGPEKAMDRITWSEAAWTDTLWQYETPNPHFLYDIGGRLCLRIAQWNRGEEPWVIDEMALRLAPFLAGLGALWAWYRLAVAFGMGGSAGWGCLILSIHPWFIRYMTEARGYAFVFLLLPLALLALRRALEESRGSNWAAYGAMGFLLIYAWPGMLIPWLCLNAGAFVHVCRRKEAALRGRRLVLANILAGMALLQMVAPCFAQVGAYFEADATRLPLNGQWWRDLAARLAAGIDWHDHRAYSGINPLYVTVESLLRETPYRVLLPLHAIASVLGLIAGCVATWRKGPAHRWILGSLLFSPALLCVPATISGVYIFHWYLVYLLPGAVMTVVAGIRVLAGGKPWKMGPVAIAVVAYVGVCFPALRALREQSLDPRREAVLAVRGTLDPSDASNTRFITAHVGATALPYDPFGWVINKEATESPGNRYPGLPALMRVADLLGRELHVHVGFPANARTDEPEVMRIIDESGYFERTHVLPGIEPQFSREIYRYTGGMFDSLR